MTMEAMMDEMQEMTPMMGQSKVDAKNPMEVPDEGIATLVIEEETEFPDSEGGITDLSQAATQLAELGRAEDTFLAHVAKDEHIIPMALLDSNPDIKRDLYLAMEEMGLDPQQYIVGNELNVINPQTGLPEFGLGSFVKRIRKKIAKGVKKVGKRLIKVAKKTLPVVLPIALAMTPLGPIYGAMAGSGIGTLLQGGNLKDAFKSAALAGATAGVFKGIQGGIQGAGTGQGFFGGATQSIQSSLADPVGRFRSFGQSLTSRKPLFSLENLKADTGSATEPRVVDNVLEIDQNLPSSRISMIDTGETIPNLSLTPAENQLQISSKIDSLTRPEIQKITDVNTGIDVKTIPETTTTISKGGADQIVTITPDGNIVPFEEEVNPNLKKMLSVDAEQFAQKANFKNLDPKPQIIEENFLPRYSLTDKSALGLKGGENFGSELFSELTPPKATPIDTRGFRESLMDALTKKEDKLGSLKQAFFPQVDKRTTVERFLELQNDPNLAGLSDDLKYELASKPEKLNPLRQFGPLTGAGLLAGKPLGLYDTPEEEPVPDPYGGVTSEELLNLNPTVYYPGVAGLTPFQTIQNIRVPTFNQPVTAKDGKEITSFPRKTGAISGPGTETSDSIPAMLSDGEFVMNAKAVRGAGNGSRRRGVKKMYQLMRTFERGVS